MLNAFTIDVEEWFHVCGVGGPLAADNWDSLPSRVVETTELVLDMLNRHNTRATFFILGWVAERHPSLVARIKNEGHEVGSHGYAHTRVYELTPESFRRDLDRSIALLEEADSGPVRGFRAPEWSINERSLWALDALVEAGLSYDSSMTPLRLIGHPSYPQIPYQRATNNGELYEFPPLVTRRFGQNMPLGGGWGLRMSSPQTVLDELDRRNGAGQAAALFVHPWEIDPQPPRVTLPLGLRFAHYYRLEGFAKRLDEILHFGRFAPMAEVLGLQVAA